MLTNLAIQVDWYNYANFAYSEKKRSMQKPSALIVLLVALAMLLAACGQLTPPEITQAPVAEQSSQPVDQATAAETQSQESNDAVVATQAVAPTAAAEPECRVDTSLQPDPALANRFPKVGNTEWSLGLDDAYVTIEEYSDFQ